MILTEVLAEPLPEQSTVAFVKQRSADTRSCTASISAGSSTELALIISLAPHRLDYSNTIALGDVAAWRNAAKDVTLDPKFLERLICCSQLSLKLPGTEEHYTEGRLLQSSTWT